jgi:hypothetical protein
VVEGVVNLIAEDLQQEKTGRFGTIRIHSQLLRGQLEQLRARVPSVATESNFVDAYLRTFTFNADASWAHDLAERRRYLESVRDVVMPLAPVFNSHKAAVLYHLLDLNRQEVRGGSTPMSSPHLISFVDCFLACRVFSLVSGFIFHLTSPQGCRHVSLGLKPETSMSPSPNLRTSSTRSS